MYKHLLQSAGIVGTALVQMASPATAQSLLEQLGSAVSESSVSLNMRFRHETVAQDNALADAAASTLRTRLTLQSAEVEGFTALLEVDNVSTIGSDHYDAFIFDEYRGTHSIIADPVGTEVNQAYLQYRASEQFQVRAGNQRILHGAQRFVGGVGWRQNEQTFDAVTASFSQGANSLDYSYVWNVNRIFNSSKPSVQAANLDTDSHFLLASHVADWGSLSGFVYALDFSDVAALSSLSAGLGYSGEAGPVSVNATVARQSDYGGSPVDYDATYLNLEAGLGLGPARLLAGYELLGSDDGIRAFTTPLATLHKWQGWTDLFLGTPSTGIKDSYLTLSGTVVKFALSVTWHDFKADAGDLDYGKEWDFNANYPVNDAVSILLKYASYDSDSYAVDTDKLWLMLNVVF